MFWDLLVKFPGLEPVYDVQNDRYEKFDSETMMILDEEQL